MHLLHVTQHYWPHDRGGSGRSVRTIAEGLVRRGHRVTVLAQSPDARDQRRERNGVAVLHVALSNRWTRGRDAERGFARRALGQLAPDRHPGLGVRLGRLLDELRPDLLHTHVIAGVSTRVWRQARRRGVPVVHTLRDDYLGCARGTMLRDEACAVRCTACALVTEPRRRRTEHVDAVVGISRFVLERHLELGFFARTPVRRVIPNGISFPAEAETATASPRPGGALRVGYLGRLHPSKGVELLLDAAREAGDERVEVHVGGAGAPAHEAELRRRATGAAVRFHGAVDAAAFLAGVDLLVVPSRFEEPFGRVVIEANARGIPVLAARRGGLSELVLEGRTGWLFDPDEPGVLRARLAALAARGEGRDLTAMAPACRAHARRYGPERILAGHLRLYGKLLALPAEAEFEARAAGPRPRRVSQR